MLKISDNWESINKENDNFIHTKMGAGNFSDVADKLND